MIVTKEAVHTFHSHLECTFCHGLQSCLTYIYELQLGRFNLPKISLSIVYFGNVSFCPP